jgi:hypothetical protein
MRCNLFETQYYEPIRRFLLIQRTHSVGFGAKATIQGTQLIWGWIFSSVWKQGTQQGWRVLEHISAPWLWPRGSGSGRLGGPTRIRGGMRHWFLRSVHNPITSGLDNTTTNLEELRTLQSK